MTQEEGGDISEPVLRNRVGKTRQYVVRRRSHAGADLEDPDSTAPARFNDAGHGIRHGLIHRSAHTVAPVDRAGVVRPASGEEEVHRIHLAAHLPQQGARRITLVLEQLRAVAHLVLELCEPVPSLFGAVVVKALPRDTETAVVTQQDSFGDEDVQPAVHQLSELRGGLEMGDDISVVAVVVVGPRLTEESCTREGLQQRRQ